MRKDKEPHNQGERPQWKTNKTVKEKDSASFVSPMLSECVVS